MRVAQLAELSKTTVRTVRYYHSLGLLPIPETVEGRREYTVTHLARVCRIRWLVAAGVSLADVKQLLDETTPDVVDDLSNTLAGIDRQISELQLQRERLAVLLHAAQDGVTLTPLPPPVAVQYAHLEDAAPDAHTLQAVRSDRMLAELALYQGLPSSVRDLFYADFDADQARVTAYGQDFETMSDADIEQAAEQRVRQLTSNHADQLDLVAAQITEDDINRLYALYVGMVSPRAARMGTAVLRKLRTVLAPDGIRTARDAAS